MKIRTTFVFQFTDPKSAETIRDALEVDNYDHVRTTLDGNKLTAEIEADSLLSLLHTTEDYLSCLVIAENVLEQTGSNKDNSVD